MNAIASDTQHTLGGAVTLSGVGLHSGLAVAVCVRPAAPGTGRVFVRTDLADRPEIQGVLANVTAAARATTLTAGGASVRTVEHLLGALAGLGIDNARIELDGPEVPLLDGSALPWTDALLGVGTLAQALPRARIALPRALRVGDEKAYVEAVPCDGTELGYEVTFASSAIGTQRLALALTPDVFARALAPARTFVMQRELDALRAAGLIRGGTLDAALVCDDRRWLNPPLRFADEPVRHKLLDLVGDLALLGALPLARVTAVRAGHALHHQMARALYDFASG